MRGRGEKVAVYKPRGEVSEDTSPANSLQKLEEINTCRFKPPGLWCFVIAAGSRLVRARLQRERLKLRLRNVPRITRPMSGWGRS